jgi:uncharacterized surface protein with fasciclin (FAS1) repeats
MKPHLPIHLIAIVGMMASFLPSRHASAQAGTDATNPEPPAPTAPTVPSTGTGGPKPVDLDPKIPQAEPTGKTEEVPGTGLAIPEIVAGAIDYTSLAGALRAAGLSDRLRADGPFTLLAPDNNAFAALPEGVLPMLMKPENVEILRKILTYHIIPRKITIADLTPGTHLSSQGEALTVVGGAEGKLTIQGAGFGRTDVMAKNGVIHNVKAVLIPPTMTIEDFTPGETQETAVAEENEVVTETEVLEDE